MGSILTTGPSFDHADWAHLSPFFQKWLRAVEKYGAVIGDISAWSKQFTYIAVEAAIADDFRAQWSDPEQAALTQVMRQLEVVVPPEAETT